MSTFANARNWAAREAMKDIKEGESLLQVSLKELDDEALMRRVQLGSQEAFSVLFDRYSGLLLRVGTRLFRNATEAEDLVQEVFLYLFRKSHVFDPSKGLVRSWLFQVTYSRAFNHHKSRTGNRRKGPTFKETFSSQDAEPRPGPEHLAELGSWRSYFLKAFSNLREEQRKTIEMYFYEGYTLRGVTEKTGYSFSSVKTHLYRGLK